MIWLGNSAKTYVWLDYTFPLKFSYKNKNKTAINMPFSFAFSVCIPVCGYVLRIAGILEARSVRSIGDGVTGSCELLLWVLGTDPWYSMKEICALNCWVTFLHLNVVTLNCVRTYYTSKLLIKKMTSADLVFYIIIYVFKWAGFIYDLPTITFKYRQRASILFKLDDSQSTGQKFVVY